MPRPMQIPAVCRQSQPAVRAPRSCPGAGRDERRAIRAEGRPGSPLGWPGRNSARREEASRAGWASFSSILYPLDVEDLALCVLPAKAPTSVLMRVPTTPSISPSTDRTSPASSKASWHLLWFFAFLQQVLLRALRLERGLLSLEDRCPSRAGRRAPRRRDPGPRAT